jgi:hypothetical protein
VWDAVGMGAEGGELVGLADLGGSCVGGDTEDGVVVT